MPSSLRVEATQPNESTRGASIFNAARKKADVYEGEVRVSRKRLRINT
jgi:hypothetical protein